MQRAAGRGEKWKWEHSSFPRSQLFASTLQSPCRGGGSPHPLLTPAHFLTPPQPQPGQDLLGSFSEPVHRGPLLALGREPEPQTCTPKPPHLFTLGWLRGGACIREKASLKTLEHVGCNEEEGARSLQAQMFRGTPQLPPTKQQTLCKRRFRQLGSAQAHSLSAGARSLGDFREMQCAGAV